VNRIADNTVDENASVLTL